MTAAQPVRRSEGTAHAMPAGLRTTVAVGLVVLATADLAAIDTLLLPRVLASRGHGPGDGSPLSRLVHRPPRQPALAPAPSPMPAPSPAPTLAPTASAVSAAATATAVPEQAPDAEGGSSSPAERMPSSWPMLLFAPNTAWLSPQSRDTLAEVARQLEQDSDLRVLLTGHTDDAGLAEINHALSLERALRARAWLVTHGARPAQLAVRGFGSAKPLVAGRSVEARAQNRRVEITLRERSSMRSP